MSSAPDPSLPPAGEAAGPDVGRTRAGGFPGPRTAPRWRLRVEAGVWPRTQGWPALTQNAQSNGNEAPNGGAHLTFLLRQDKHYMQLASRGTRRETTYRNISWNLANIHESDRTRVLLPSPAHRRHLLKTINDSQRAKEPATMETYVDRGSRDLTNRTRRRGSFGCRRASLYVRRCSRPSRQSARLKRVVPGRSRSQTGTIFSRVIGKGGRTGEGRTWGRGTGRRGCSAMHITHPSDDERGMVTPSGGHVLLETAANLPEKLVDLRIRKRSDISGVTGRNAFLLGKVNPDQK